ncbi:MAG TPA: S8 family serine peptidase [Thermoanaerobaculia bacterium]|jgi:hypothetical protein|nr:S8 family serine peptidase [Thermoanaerobaculia bacterium]
MWRSLLILALALPASAATWFVELRDDAPARFRSELATKVVHQYSLAFNGVVVELSTKEAEEIRKLPSVVAVHRDHAIARFEPTVNDVVATDIVDARARVHASALPARGAGIVVAIIDSGIDATHPALRFAGGYDFAQNDPIPEDVDGHGTHVAGIIAANGADIVGVAPDATLLIYKVVHHDGDGKESSVVAALERAMDPNGDGDPSDHVDVVNLSLGWEAGSDSITARAVDRATAAGIVVVAAAGNIARTPAQIQAPAVAPTSIAVANAITELEVIRETSRGPTPGTLAFKPDIAALGENVVSTARGGGLTTKSGTSMSSPHVAGVAALLLELHPDWTPADVKAALVSTTRAMTSPPLARGAGFVDAQAAHEAKFFVDASGLSFGVNGAKSGTFDATRTFTITYRSQVPAAFTAIALGTPAGATITITPSTFSLVPGESRSVSVRLRTNNGELPFPADTLTGGAIRLQSAAGNVAVPWGLVRTARATVTYDGTIDSLFVSSATRTRLPYHYAPGAMEMYMAPGERWDFMVVSDDARLVIAEGVRVDDDARVELRAADASRTFTLDARNGEGVPLHTLEGHEVKVWMTLANSAIGSDLVTLGSVRDIHLSPHSSRVHFAPLEAWVAPSQAVVAMHPELSGAGGVLTETAYQHARLRWTSPRAVRATPQVAYRSGNFLSTIVFGNGLTANETMDVYLTSRTVSDAFAAISFAGERDSLALLRATEDGIVSSAERTVAPSAHRAANGSEIAIGRGAAHPFGLATYVGAFGESRVAEKHWSLFDAAGALVAHGTNEQPQIAPRYRYVAGNNVLRGELDITYGTQTNDLVAPTFTSLRVLDANGDIAERLDVDEAGVLRFSAADLDVANDYTSRAMRPERTRVSYRVHGTLAWIPLAVVIEGADNGSQATLGHIPSGDLYRVDLATATTTAAFIDLRIELEDAAGNKTIWSQTPVFAVGTVVMPPRRRAVH